MKWLNFLEHRFSMVHKTSKEEVKVWSMRHQEMFNMYSQGEHKILLALDVQSQQEMQERLQRIDQYQKLLTKDVIDVKSFATDQNNKNLLEKPLDHSNITSSFNIVKEVEFDRRGNCTCPFNTIVLFISNEKIGDIKLLG